MTKSIAQERIGFQIGEKLLNGRLVIIKTYERKEKGWKPRKPDFNKLQGQWIVIEPHILSLEDPVLCLVEDDEDLFFDSDGLCQNRHKLTNLEIRKFNES